MPERHLGLVQAEEQPALQALIAEAAQLMRDGVNLDALIAAAATTANPAPPAKITPPGQRIALARDAAFSFVYPHLLHGWRAAGAEVLPFSPLADEAPDPSADVCWLPGGYPELHAGPLAAASHYRRGLRAFAETKPVHGECGGYMAMGQGLVDKDGVRHEMAGLLGLVTSYASRKMHLGYRVARLGQPIPGHAAGTDLAGHEFHYSTILSQPDAPLAEVTDATGAPVPETGSYRRQPGGGLSTGTYFHLIAGAS
jgi:cobyrinic acid a,c-diamide synthase